MTIDAGQLLRRLEPPVRSSAGGRSPNAPHSEGASFDRMLTLVSRGSGVGGRSVHVCCETQPSLKAEQLMRLSAAAEIAERAGAERSLMLIDGRAFVMDVASREIALEIRDSTQHELVELNAAVYVAGSDESSHRHNHIPGLRAWLPPSVAAQIDAKLRTT